MADSASLAAIERTWTAAQPRPPALLNAALTLLVPATLLASLIYLGRTESHGLPYIAASVVFSLAFLCNYSLIHEACHEKLQVDPRLNYASGAFCGLFFPISFSLIHNTHFGHHLRNRTDDELFDHYYPGDNVLAKRMQWFGLLLGAHYLLLLATTIFVLVMPRGAIVRM